MGYTGENQVARGWAIAIGLLPLLILGSLVHNVLSSHFGDMTALHPLAAAGYLATILGLRLKQKGFRTLLHFALMTLALQRTLEGFLQGWPALITPAADELTAAFDIGGTLTLHTTLILFFLNASELCRLQKRSTLVAFLTLGACSVALIRFPGAFYATERAHLSALSLLCGCLLAGYQFYSLRHLPFFHSVFARDIYGLILRGVMLGDIVLFWLSDRLHNKLIANPNVDQGMHQITTYALVMISLGMLLVSGHILRKGARYMHQQALLDPLTGISGRHGLETKVQGLHQPYGVILFDLDHFKSLNDIYGHLEGDRLLREVAQEISSHLDVNDTFVRWGGEEFLILSHISEESQLVRFAETLRAHIAGLPQRGRGKYTHFPSASFGVCAIAENTISLERAIKRADKALYAAKENGRNRVELYHKSMPDIGSTNIQPIRPYADIAARSRLDALKHRPRLASRNVTP